MDRLREAMQDVHKIQRCLGKADFQLGRTRYILRKSGFGEILGKKRGHTILNGVTENNSHIFFWNWWLLTIPGRDRFTVRLDWIEYVTIKCKDVIAQFSKNLGAIELSRTAKQTILINMVRETRLSTLLCAVELLKNHNLTVQEVTKTHHRERCPIFGTWVESFLNDSSIYIATSWI